MGIKKTKWVGMVGLAFLVGILQSGCQGTEGPGASESSSQPGASAPSASSGTARSPAKSQATASTSAPAASQPVPASRTATLAAGTVLKVRTTTTLSTNQQSTGDSFVATLEEPIAEGDWVIAPKGSTVEGRIVEADKGGRVQGVARMTVALSRLKLPDGQTVDLPTEPLTVAAQSTKGEDATKIAIGTGIGAAVGALAGGKKGAAIGAATGAGAGTGVVLATRGDAAEISSESVLEFKLRSPVAITEKR